MELDSLLRRSVAGQIVADVPFVLPLGTYAITLAVDDGFGGTDTDEVVVTVVDRTPPVFLDIQANPEGLGPPNHKFVPVTFTVRPRVNCDAAPVSRIVGVASNEPVNGFGDGNTAPDWLVTGLLTADIRAERSGKAERVLYNQCSSDRYFGQQGDGFLCRKGAA